MMMFVLFIFSCIGCVTFFENWTQKCRTKGFIYLSGKNTETTGHEHKGQRVHTEVKVTSSNKARVGKSTQVRHVSDKRVNTGRQATKLQNKTGTKPQFQFHEFT